MRGLASPPKQDYTIGRHPDEETTRQVTPEEANDKRVAHAADDNEPEGKSPEGHGFDDQSAIADKRFSGEGKTYGKIQEDHQHVASKAQGINPGILMKDESLESTGYDMSKRTRTGGDE